MTSLHPTVHRSGIRRIEAEPFHFAPREDWEKALEMPNHYHLMRSDVMTLAEVLQFRDYDTHAIIAASVLTEVFGLFQQGFETVKMFGHFNEPPNYGWATADQVTDTALEYLSQAESPFFLFVHYWDPHGPYRPPEPFVSRFEHPYDGEIAFMDSQLRRLFAAIDYSNTIIVLVSDHGEEFGENGVYSHGLSLFGGVVHVPLIIRAPGISPARINSISRSIDVMPTVLALADIEPPASIQGCDLFSPRTQELPAYSEALMRGPELYSLRTLDGTTIWDASHNCEVTAIKREDHRDMINDLMHKNQALAKGREDQTLSLSGDIKAHLKALGYIK